MNGLWHTGRVCWICLEQNIMIERDQRTTKSYMESFQHFYEKVEAYRKENELDEVVPYYESWIIPCRKCGSTNEVEFEYCTNCGSNIRKICPKCGQSYNLELNFCGKCGTAIPEAVG